MSGTINAFQKSLLCRNGPAIILTTLDRAVSWRGRKEGSFTKMLDVFITSRVRRKIVVVYAKYPDFKTHVRGLAKLIKEDPGNIQRELKRLEKSGFLLTEKQGNAKIYLTNKSFPIFKELQAIVIKSQQLEKKGREA